MHLVMDDGLDEFRVGYPIVTRCQATALDCEQPLVAVAATEK